MVELQESNCIADLLENARLAESRLGAQVWFRGHANRHWRLVPGAHRRHPILESQMANHFRMRAPALYARCPDHRDYAGWLPLMQHYGLPTRLLDWTESAAVAAFFAVTPSANSEHGTIWILSPGHLNSQSIGDSVPFLSHDSLRSIIEAAYVPQDGVSSVAQSSVTSQVVAAIGPRSDSRMAAQLGNYTIHGTRLPLEEHQRSSDFLARTIIPESAKARIADELSILGIRLTALFPDLAHLAQETADLRALGPNRENLEV